MNIKKALLSLVFSLLLAGLVSADEHVVAVKGGTILTVTNGTIEDGIIVIRSGKIAEIGKNVTIPADAKVIDATGKFIMPGIIDAHSHIALSRGDTNEVTSPYTSQVDMMHAFVPDDYAIYRGLASGVTTTKTMHGSANVIGGINVTIKMKWGTSLDEMVISGARRQLKMALGENPLRLYGGRGKPPATRPGLFAGMRQKFIDAQEYKRKWDEYQAKVDADEKDATPPKRNLELDTLKEVLEGKMSIDCHCYSANEIVVMLQVADEFNLPLVALSHALEGYQVRDEIAKRGINVLTHTDWWGYKWEAYNSIPYGPGLLVKAGINTCIVSDSGDVMRRLNREAAKIIKYSGISEDEALALITINAAKGLEIDKITGSLEVGKDADIAIFDRHPLDSFTKCVMTFIEGKIWFDINDVKTALLD